MPGRRCWRQARLPPMPGGWWIPLESWAGAAAVHLPERGFLDPFDVPDFFGAPCRRSVPAAAAGAAEAPLDLWELHEHQAADAKRAAMDEGERPSQRMRPSPAQGSLAWPDAAPEADESGSALSALGWSSGESELREALEALRQLLCGASGTSGEALDEMCAPRLERLVETCCASPRHATRALSLLAPTSLPEPALLALSRSFGDPGCAGHAASAFVDLALLPRFQALGGRPATRGLLSAALGPLLAEHPAAVLDHLVLPLLWADSGTAQAEALTRLAKELPPPTLARLIEAMARGGDGAWSDAQAGLLKDALARKPPLRGETLGALLDRAEMHVEATKGSLKFGNAVRGRGCGIPDEALCS
eukprot:scaffold4240_cov120-Isochrysis_galbana.AAC.12